MKKNKEPQVTLVGAGPGDPIYYYQRSKALAKDVVLYDARQMKNYFLCSQKALKIFVCGKRKGSHEYTRGNQSIDSRQCTYVWKCSSFKGDPFIFWSWQ
jgi:uroporphyrin-III C-methyltransferase